LLLAKPLYSAMSEAERASSARAVQRIIDQEPKVEAASFVTSPAIDTNPQFFFGTGDGSNGYYGEQLQRPR
jgi:hypothetical protein